MAGGTNDTTTTTGPTLITIRSKASAERKAEIVWLHLSVRSDSDEQAQSSRNVTTAVSAIRSSLAPHIQRTTDGDGDDDAAISATSAVAAVAVSSLTTSSYDEVDKDHMRTGKRVYVADANVRVQFRDFALLGAKVAEFSALADVHVESVEWALTPATREQLEEQARVQALRTAVARAAAYAEVVTGGAAGGGQVSVVKIEDRDNYEDHHSGGGGGRAMMMHAKMRVAPGDADDYDQLGAELGFQPETMSVTGELVVDFHLK